MAYTTALSGLQAASTSLDVAGNNIANASTAGFKSSRAEFGDVYASSALGVSATSAGTGVQVTAITQQFTTGPINASPRSLDLAINGEGFFVLSAAGSTVYSRSGAFQINKDGNMVNGEGQILTGYLTDSLGNVTGSTGDLTISNSNIQPKATANISAALNLNVSDIPKTAAFQTGFTSNNPPATNTYNYTTQVYIYDSLGNQHTLQSYYVKSTTPNVWHVYVGIDGNDVTPTKQAVPTGIPPENFNSSPPAAPAQPYTIVFNSTGALVAHNTAVPPIYWGAGPATPTIPAAGGPYDTAGSLTALGINDLIINGTAIQPLTTVVDQYSKTDAGASAISIAQAINNSTSLHGVLATVQPTTVTLTSSTYGALAAGDLTINGVQITGTCTDNASLAALMSGALAQNNITVTQVGSTITLTAASGMNIQMQTAGSAAHVNFTNFSLNGGSAVSQVQDSYVQLSTPNPENSLISISGNNPGIAGFSQKIYAGIEQSNSDILQIQNWLPGLGANGPQVVTIDLSGVNQFNASYSIFSLSQDGYTTGQLAGLSVDQTGIITARYTNSQTQTLGQIAITTFSNDQGLQPIGNTSWAETYSSGIALVGKPGTGNLGNLKSGALEDSNVDLTNELVNLIVAQRNFQANSQSIKTEDTMTNTILNIR